MANRRFPAFSACLLFLVFWASGIGTFATEAKKSPNIIFILTDDQRLEDINHMPRLNKLIGAEGATFNNFFATVSLCCPSRTCILRGQYAHNTGVMTNGGGNGGFAVANSNGCENSTIATWLHDRGYATALIGKYLNGYPGAKGDTYVPPGWDFWASAVRGNPYSEYNYTLNENGKSVQYGSDPKDYGTDVYTEKALSFIKDNSSNGKPFFIYLAFYAPHSPATPAERHTNMFTDAKIPRSKAFNESDVSGKPAYIQKLEPMTDQEIASADAYYGKRLRSLQAVDESIERIYNALKDSKQLDNTYIFFAADNGFHLGEHRLRRGKQTAYETDMHLPLLVRGPGITHGAKVDQLVGNIDLAPTWSDLASAKTPDFVDGRSLKPLLHGETAHNWRQVFLVEHWNGGGGGGGRRRNAAPPSKSPDAEEDKTSMKGGDGYEATASDAVPGFYVTPSDLVEEADTYQSDEKIAQSIKKTAQLQLLSSKSGDNSATDGMPGVSEPDASTAVDTNDAGPPRRRGGGRGRRNGPNKAKGRIPEHHALRSANSTYVEYVTGEREYYDLTADADEVNNLVSKKESELKPVSDRLKLMEKAGSADARKIESGGSN